MSRDRCAQWIDAEPGEVPALLWSAAMFFCVLCGYYVLRPVRETWGIEYGDHYRWLWTGTAVGTIVATPAFGWLATRLPRRRLVQTVYALGIASLAGFWLTQRASGDVPPAAAGYAFYVWLSVFNVFATAVFWAFMADLWQRAQGRRLFGVVAVGGTLGALAGSALVTALAGPLGTVNLLLVACVLLGGAIGCAGRLGTRFGDGPPSAWAPRVGWSDALAGVRLFAANRYLLGIGVFLAAQTFVAAVLYIESRVAVGGLFPTAGVDAATAAVNRDARTEFFTVVDWTFNLIALAVQLFLTGRLVRWIGLGAMLATLPAVNFGGFAMLAFASTSVFAYGAFEVAQRASKFAVMKPAREMLFTVLSREEKYKAKQFLETAVYRGSDAGWAWLEHALSAFFRSFEIKAFVVLPLCIAWAGVGRWLGREESRRAE